jgi:integrase/recombinase XerD
MAEPRPDHVRVGGPLAPFANGFSMHLTEAGYSPASVQAHLQRLAQLSRWMGDERLDVG